MEVVLDACIIGSSCKGNHYSRECLDKIKRHHKLFYNKKIIKEYEARINSRYCKKKHF